MTNQMKEIAQIALSPRLFLKMRHPEQFSDTIIEDRLELDRSHLEYFLSSLTSRSQETDFERFARRICENEICPNLLPHTGPTGGGDSKVDSETYPVADDLALAWYRGLGREAAQERWAFAFSTKKDWLSKVKSDIAKIVGTNRGYNNAFFVTNQFVPDRKRACVEDDLRTKYSIDVRIMDMTWILNCVFKNGLEEIAVEELRIPSLSRRNERKGPFDVNREKKLNELEKRIKNSIQKNQFNRALAEDAINAANIARSLERPRAEVEGLYSRADKLAMKYGIPFQQVEVAYQWARALFWWFEDYDTFSEQYGTVEERAKGTRNVFELGRLFTLWCCLHSSIERGVLKIQDTIYNKRTETLITELNRLRGEKDRPSTALEAETLILEMQLILKLSKKEPIDDILRSLKKIVLKSEGLFGYPFDSLVKFLTISGKSMEGVPAYDELFDAIVKVASTRDGDIKAALLLVNRGEQQFNRDRNVNAIASLGQALIKLHKHETRYEMVWALYICSQSYENIGLLWAARGTLLAAVSITINEFQRYGEITPMLAACIKRIESIELRLGRLPHILAWHEKYIALQQELDGHGTLFEQDPIFDLTLIRLLLRTDFSDLKALQGLPDILDSLGLDFAANALLYALGYKERLEEMAKELKEETDIFAFKCITIKADVPLPERPEIYNQSKVTLQSQVLGCRITVESQTDQPCIEVAESILAAIESFLSTSILKGVIAYEPELTMEIKKSNLGKDLIGVSIEERSWHPHLVITCKHFDPHNISVKDQSIARDAISKIVTRAISDMVTIMETKTIETLFRDERVSDRAFIYTSTLGTQASVLGQSPKTRLKDWVYSGVHTYQNLRTEPCSPENIEKTNQEDNSYSNYYVQNTEPPPELLNPNTYMHNQINTISLIRNRLWDSARWIGTAFFICQDNPIPILGIIFSNREAGREIFIQWLKEIGKVDVKGKIRLTIVKGIDKGNPYAYRLIIGANPMVSQSSARLFNFISRFQKMNPKTSDGLDLFLSAYISLNTFDFAPAFAPPGSDGLQDLEVGSDICIRMHHIYIRNAWEIGLNDIDSVAITEDDDPIIPEGVECPPVLKLIRSRHAV